MTNVVIHVCVYFFFLQIFVYCYLIWGMNVLEQNTLIPGKFSKLVSDLFGVCIVALSLAIYCQSFKYYRIYPLLSDVNPITVTR